MQRYRRGSDFGQQAGEGQGGSWVLLGNSWGLLGKSFGVLEGSLEALGCPWQLWVLLRGFLGSSWGLLVESKIPKTMKAQNNT